MTKIIFRRKRRTPREVEGRSKDCVVKNVRLRLVGARVLGRSAGIHWVAVHARTGCHRSGDHGYTTRPAYSFRTHLLHDLRKTVGGAADEVLYFLDAAAIGEEG